MTNFKPLLARDAVTLSTVIQWAWNGTKIRWMTDDMPDVLEGTVRSIGHEDSSFLGNEEDVRDGFLRITTVNGFEVFMPVPEAVEHVRNMTMGEM